MCLLKSLSQQTKAPGAALEYFVMRSYSPPSPHLYQSIVFDLIYFKLYFPKFLFDYELLLECYYQFLQ